VSALKKERKKIRGNKKGQVPGTSKKKKVRREVKMDKCLTVELGVQDTHLREKKNKIWSISFLSKTFKVQERYVSPQKSKSRIKTFTIIFTIITIITIHHSSATHTHLDLTC